MKILWLANIPSPYRVNFFNELGKYCELTVLFEKRASSERNDSWKNFDMRNFQGVFLPGKSVGAAEAFCPSVVKYLNEGYDHIIVTTFSDLTGMLAILILKWKHISYEIESDGAFPGTGVGVKENVKKLLLSGATRYFSTAKLHDEYYLMYGAENKELVRYPFTSVLRKDVLKEPIDRDGKLQCKKALGIKEEYMILAVGQFIPRKGYDILIKSAVYLDEKYGIYIVGGTAPLEYEMMAKKHGLKNIHFIDFKNPDELEKYYEAADVFAHPTREDIWGLVINEAMARGLPVVTTDKCIAGIEMIEDGINGRIIPVDDEKALAAAIIDCISKRDYGREALKRASIYTVEDMALAHIKVWHESK